MCAQLRAHTDDDDYGDDYDEHEIFCFRELPPTHPHPAAKTATGTTRDKQNQRRHLFSNSLRLAFIDAVHAIGSYSTAVYFLQPPFLLTIRCAERTHTLNIQFRLSRLDFSGFRELLRGFPCLHIAAVVLAIVSCIAPSGGHLSFLGHWGRSFFPLGLTLSGDHLALAGNTNEHKRQSS